MATQGGGQENTGEIDLLGYMQGGRLKKEQKKLIPFIGEINESIKDKLQSMTSKTLGGIKTQLITLELIRQSIENWKKEKQIYNLEITPSNCLELSLSFQNILQISNLENLINLETLRLDNNLIMKIENLKALKKIKWLDLSFNQISSIEGLDELENLTDLSLFSNQLTKIENLDKNRKLNVLSVGANLITDVKDMVNYLRRFTNLQALCVHMNTFCKDEESVQKALEDTNSQRKINFPSSYDPIIANLVNIKYLDWKPVTSDAIKKAKESQSNTKDENQREDGAEEEFLNQRAKINHANINDIIDFSENYEKELKREIGGTDESEESEEYKQLMQVPDLENQIISAKKNMTDHINKYKLRVFEFQGKKDEIIDKNLKIMAKNEEYFIDKSKLLIREFKRKFKSFVKELGDGKLTLVKSVEDAEPYFGLKKLKEDLLEIEVYCKKKFSEFIDEFKKSISKINGDIETSTEELKSELEGVKNEMNRNIGTSVADLKKELEDYNDRKQIEEGNAAENNNEPDEKISKEDEKYNNLNDIFAEGEFLTNIEKITEVLSDKIDKLCENLKNKREAKFNEYFDKLNDEEYYRNKKRIADIQEIYVIYWEKAKKEIENTDKKFNNNKY